MINKRESAGLKHFNDPKAFIKYSDDIYKNIKEYNIGKKRKILIVFDDMIADMINNKTPMRNHNMKITSFNKLH